MPPENPGSREWVAIAQVLGSRGNRGELRVAPLTGRPGRFNELGELYLLGPAGAIASNHRFEVQSAWEHRGCIILKLQGIDSISEAERWRGCEARIPRSRRMPLPEGEYYQSDLIGFEAVKRDGQRVGVVRDWRECGGPPLLVVEGEQGQEVLIPFAASICAEIDSAGRRIVVDLPEGLEGLNR